MMFGPTSNLKMNAYIVCYVVVCVGTSTAILMLGPQYLYQDLLMSGAVAGFGMSSLSRIFFNNNLVALALSLLGSVLWISGELLWNILIGTAEPDQFHFNYLNSAGILGGLFELLLFSLLPAFWVSPLPDQKDNSK